MVTPRKLDTQKILIDMCKVYCDKLKSVLDNPSIYGLKIDEEDTLLEGMYADLRSLEADLVNDEYNAESMCTTFAEIQHTIISTLEAHGITIDTIGSVDDTEKREMAKHGLASLNSMKFLIDKIAGNPIRYKPSASVEELKKLSNEIDLMISMSTMNVIPDELLSMSIAEVTYIFMTEIVPIFSTRADKLYEML